MYLILFCAGFLGATAALMGALGAHSLTLDAAQTVSWNTADKYLMFHAVALIGLGILYDRRQSKWIWLSAMLLAIGSTLFSGSIFLLILTPYTWLWPLTPLGGVMLTVGWLWFAAGALYHR